MEHSLHRVSLGSRRAQPGLSFYLCTFGQLKLSIDAQDRVLLLHIMEGKGLMSKAPGICDPYVKISLIPEDQGLCCQKTQTVPDSRDPVFHEHFFFPVQEDDEQKRLLVAVWNRAGDSRQSGLIGCMSFGVRSLLTPDKEISGWYYLLGEDLGRTKHLKVARRRLRPLRDPLLRMPGGGDAENGEELKITIPRGKDGFGFTICCDSPVRVQAVDSGGPADRAGLQQLDTVLQLNERPVEHWKCVELAHEIRSCPSEIILLVWRLVPQVKPGPDGGVLRRASCKSAHDLQLPPNKREKNCAHGAQARPEQRHSCHLVCDSSDGLLLGGWERYTEVAKRGGQHTLPALSRATAPTDPNYIILAPLNPGSQLLRPVYQEDAIPEESGSPSKGKSYTGLGKKSRLMKTVQTMKGHGNYQNCSVMRPHTPHSSYGTYVTLAPKVLVFPIFVQPLDLCNPARTLLLSEELLLYEGRNKAAEVTLFAYSDLLLFTKEDEPGRCNVLRNPLYLQSVKLQEGPSEDLKFCVLYLAEKAECLFTLEAHSQEQKKRVCWCLSENIAKQQQLAASPPQSKMFESEVDEKREMPLEEGKGPGADDPPPSKDPSPGQEPLLEQDLPLNKDSSSGQEPSPGQESLSSKDSTSCKEPPPRQEPSPTKDSPPRQEPPPCQEPSPTKDSSPCQEPPAAQALPPCQDLPAKQEPSPSQDPLLSQDLPTIQDPPAQDLSPCQDLPPSQAPEPAEALAETTGSGDPPAATGGLPVAARPAFVIPEVRLDSAYSQKAEAEGGSSGDEEDAEEAEEGDEGEEDEDEDTSDDNYGEHSEAKRSSMIETGQGAEGGFSLRVQNSLRRRTHSEGSLLQEPRGPCFSSDTTLNCSDGEGTTSSWAIPSPRTLKKELGRNGGSMHHLSLFFTGHRKMSGPDTVGDNDEGSRKRKSKNLAKDMKNKLGIFRRRNESPGAQPAGKADKMMKSFKPTSEEALKWGESLEKLLLHKYGLAVFQAFLRTEFSEENLEFWLACEDFKKVKSQSKMAAKAKKIFAEYIAIQACKERLSNTWLDVRHIEKYVDQGKSGTRELLWSWAQKNKTVGDLLQILQEMGHHRAIHLIANHGAALNPPEQTHQADGFPDLFSKETANVTVDNVPILEHNKKGIVLNSSISFQNIIEGTNNFHKGFLIGEGEIFEVYRAEIQNQTYAIKLFKQEKTMQCKKQWKRFLSELEVLLLFHHPNILELAAYFTESEKFCLVYPFMRNGSLFDRLQCVGNTAPLSWHIRISVLIGTAKAIQYLHNTVPCSVICGSISSANILLDDQFQPKLMDFAMAHFRPHLEPQSATISMSSGSSNHLWYMPEEYIRQGKLSTKTDVYSFGIVIMEALTGCKVVLDDPKHIQLRDLLMELMEKRGLDSCVSFLDKKVFPCPRNFSAKLFSLAGQCAATRAKLRPSMDEVLTTLESTQASLYFAEDPPASLKSFRCPSPLFLDNVPSIPVEDDERQNRQPLLHDQHLRKERMAQKIPFECSQSEVTYLGLDGKTGSKRKEDACKLPSSPPEEHWPPKHAAPVWDSGAPGVDADPSAEAAGHAHRSRPVETSCSSEFVWNECEQNKKESILPEDKEDDKYYPGT